MGENEKWRENIRSQKGQGCGHTARNQFDLAGPYSMYKNPIAVTFCGFVANSGVSYISST